MTLRGVTWPEISSVDFTKDIDLLFGFGFMASEEVVGGSINGQARFGNFMVEHIPESQAILFPLSATRLVFVRHRGLVSKKKAAPFPERPFMKF
ncbi:MAG: hypothetical protein AAGJ79_02010 [Verrucomicrobiota bacterium]